MRFGTGSVEQRKYGEAGKRTHDFEMEEVCGCMDNVLSRMTTRLLTRPERRKWNVGAVKLETGGINSGKFRFGTGQHGFYFISVPEELVFCHPVLDVEETLGD